MKENKNDGWENPQCNLCGSKRYAIVWDNTESWLSKGVFRIVKCRECNLVYLSPRPSEKIIGRYYEPDSYWGVDFRNFNPGLDISYRDEAYGFVYKDILTQKNSGSILDIGAGTGLFLTKFKERGWVIDGVELSKQACKFANRVYDIDLKNGDLLEQIIPLNFFDVVTLNSCLEHLHKPKETLIKITKLLKRKGLLVITVPNFNSIGRIIFNRNWYALQPPTHLYHFTPITITTMLRTSGFKITEIKHSQWKHNYYIIFESIRMLFSPKFKKTAHGGLVNKNALKRKSKPSFLLEAGKVVAKAFAGQLALLELLLGKGEVITVYAKKA